MPWPPPGVWMDEAAGGGTRTVGSLVLLALILIASLLGVAMASVPPAIGLPVAGSAGLLLLARGLAVHRTVEGAKGRSHSMSRAFSASEAVLSSLDVTHVLCTAVEVGGQLSRHASAALLFLVDEGSPPTCRASWGVDPPPEAQTRFGPLDAYVSEVLKTQKTTAISLQFSLVHTWQTVPGPHRSDCLLPLRTRGGIIGILVLLSHKSSGAFRRELGMLEYFARQAAMAIDNARLYHQVEDLFVSAIKSLAAAVDAKDAYTHGHSEEIADLVSMIARELKLLPKEEEKVRLAGLLHDVGKIGIPDAILRKPGKLNPTERAIMMTHVTLGASIIDRPGPLQDLVSIVRHHHEWYDGRGYPDGLRGDHIPIGAAILAVADAFDAMTSHRVYHEARSLDGALQELRQHAGIQFHPGVVDALVNVVNHERAANSVWYRNLEQRIRESTTRAQPTGPSRPSNETELVSQLSEEITQIEDLSTLSTRIVGVTANALGAGQFALMILDDTEQILQVEAAVGAGPQKGVVIPRRRSLAWRAIEHRAAQRHADGSAIYAPLVSGGNSVGVLEASGTGLGEAQMRLLSLAAEAVAPTVHAAHLRARREWGEVSDPLTGLLNRKALLARLHEEASRYRRYGTRVALALAEIPGLSEFNARHGSEAGDELIQRIGEILSPSVRVTDVTVRIHGGRFAVLMPGLERVEAVRAARRLQEMLSDRQVAIKGQFIPVPSLTWMVVTCPHDGQDGAELLARAEGQLSRRQHPPSH